MSVGICVQSGFGVRRVRTRVAENCWKDSFRYSEESLLCIDQLNGTTVNYFNVGLWLFSSTESVE